VSAPRFPRVLARQALYDDSFHGEGEPKSWRRLVKSFSGREDVDRVKLDDSVFVAVGLR
jgi:hypothetical protein